MGLRVCELHGCHRPAFVDPTTRIQHDYCGRTHAREAMAHSGQDLQPPHGVCHTCKLPGCDEPVYYDADTDRVHEYCCRSHAAEACDRGIQPASNRPLQGRGHPAHRCSLQGCSAPRYVDATGYEHAYCGRTHAKMAEQRGQQPVDVSEAEHVSYVWRGRAGEPPYTISVLQNAHPRYQGIKEQFRASWLHPGPTPTVQRVLQIRNPQPIFERYTRRQAGLASARGDANELRRFHGTRMKCRFGIDPNQQPCEDPECAVCSICAQAFSADHAGRGPNAALVPFPGGGLRYGRGLYFSKTASKSNDYAGESERPGPDGSPWRVMFLCKVCCGSSYRAVEERLEQGQVAGILASDSYDSVTGLTSADGGCLNYEENVVYDETSAIPSYLIVYKLR